MGCVPYGSLFDDITSLSLTTSSVAIPVEGLSTTTSTRRSSSFACGGGSLSVTATKRLCDSSFKYSLTAFDAVVISLFNNYERYVVSAYNIMRIFLIYDIT